MLRKNQQQKNEKLRKIAEIIIDRKKFRKMARKKEKKNRRKNPEIFLKNFGILFFVLFEMTGEISEKLQKKTRENVTNKQFKKRAREILKTNEKLLQKKTNSYLEVLCPLSGLGESGTRTGVRSLRSKLLFRSGTAGANPDKLLLLPKVCPARRVVQTVPAEEVVVDVLPFPNNSYSFSAVI